MRILGIVGLVVVGSVALVLSGAGRSDGGDKKDVPLWTLEGELKVHPKYLYRYYLVFGDGQKCALYGADLRQEVDQLTRLEPGARVRVRGTLGTLHHAGGTKENPSPFGPAWVLYLEVREVESLK